ncbi:DUF3841 domain-containing protein [Actinoplanes sp. NPDC048796]|uniref:DUF3841 domain-containing protein n=1 Tax=Actinoplanes sp. NPDC048796 TaxID=3155640 RepID=UPI0033CF8892
MWFWARTTRRNLLADVRCAAREKPGSVLVTALIRRHGVLLSHFDTWNLVLNDIPVHTPSTTDTEVDQTFEAIRKFTDWKWHEPKPPQLKRIIEDTWELVLDTTLWSPTDHWQATVPEVRLTDVVDAVVAEPRRRSVARRRPGAEVK